MQAIIWLGVVAVLLLIEIATLGLTTIWFAGGALIACAVAFLGGELWLQVIVFLAVSLILLFFTRPIAMKYMNKKTQKTNAEGLIGKHAVVTEQINNLNGTGKATINGLPWTARSTKENVIIEKDEVVTIQSISGVKLIVRPKGGEES